MATLRPPREPFVGANGYPSTSWLSYLEDLGEQLRQAEAAAKAAQETAEDVRAAFDALNTVVMRTTGATMTGNLAIFKAEPVLTLNRPNATTNARIVGQTGGLNRFAITLANATPEGVGTAGSSFTVDRYSNAGMFIDSPISVDRMDGTVFIEGTHHALRLDNLEARLLTAGIP